MNVKLGDVFSIPIGDGDCCYAQVVSPGMSFFLVGFTSSYSNMLDDFEKTAKPTLGAWTNDAEIYRGNWKLKFNFPVHKGIDLRLIEYKVHYDGRVVVESFDGTELREISFEEIDKLQYRSSISPLIFQDAMAAYNGKRPWVNEYNSLILPNFTNSPAS